MITSGPEFCKSKMEHYYSFSMHYVFVVVGSGFLQHRLVALIGDNYNLKIEAPMYVYLILQSINNSFEKSILIN